MLVADIDPRIRSSRKRFFERPSAEQERADSGEDEIGSYQGVDHDARCSQATLAEPAPAHSEHDPMTAGRAISATRQNAAT